VLYCLQRGSPARQARRVTVEHTCAACDCSLDGNAINVTIGGKTVEVCCAECAEQLKEAHLAAAAKK
jgi:hypothetical protein